MDWKREIAIAHLVKQKVAEADVEAIWLHPFPEVAANESDVVNLESELGHSLDRNLREFLLHANGWKSFFHSIDVFGTYDFLSGERHQRAAALMSTLENLRELCGFEQSELIPFAVSRDDIDIFAISTPLSSDPGKVLWFAGGVVDQFSDFNEWFLSMIDYNRRQYEQLKKQNGLS